MTRDYRDGLIEILADSEAGLKAERDAWRLLAIAFMQDASALRRELQMVDSREYICRTRTPDHRQDDRDVFLDQRDLRLGKAA